jgi:hypothetical protein
MNRAKRAEPKAVKNAAVEYSGAITQANRWFKIGLSPVEVAAVRLIREDIFSGASRETLAKTIRALVVAVIAHYDVIQPLMVKDAAYADSEGFIFVELYQQALAKRLFKLEAEAGAAR